MDGLCRPGTPQWILAFGFSNGLIGALALALRQGIPLSGFLVQLEALWLEKPQSHALSSQRQIISTSYEGHDKLFLAQSAILSSGPRMETPRSSDVSSPREREPVMECHLVLTALSGTVVNISMSVAKFDRFEDLEDHVVDHLASVTDLKVFGCTIDFLQADTQTYLENPIWEKLQQSAEYTIAFRSCCEVLPSKEIFEGCPFRDIPLTVHVSMNLEEMVPDGAFTAAPRLRHVSIEAGIRVVGAEAWQCCRQLRIVRMPASVVRIADNIFRGCQLLNSVTAPGCVEFGYKAFAECSSLQWVHAIEGVANQFCSSTRFGHYLFRDCINLATFVLQEAAHQQELPARMNARAVARMCQLHWDRYT